MIDTCRKEFEIAASEIKTFWKTMNKTFLCVLIVISLALLAILRANFLYIDDMDRAIDGYRGWGGFSRYTSQASSVLLHTNTRLSDMSPWTQIVAILVMALSCSILLYVFKIKLHKQKIRFCDILSAIILAISPYFLSCLSYKFDSPYMAVSILASVFPFLFWGTSKKLFYFTSVLGTLVMCTSYQAASGIFPMVLVAVCFTKAFLHKNKKNLKKDFLISLAVFLLTMLVFSKTIMRPITDGLYVDNTILPMGELVSGSLSHLAFYLNLLLSDFAPLWIILCVALLIIFPILACVKSKRNKIRTLILSVLSSLLIVLLMFGVYPCFTKILVEPRAMFGVGVAIALIALQISSLAFYGRTTSAKTKKSVVSYLLIAPVFGLAYCFFTFANLYGNSLSMQKDWNTFRTTVIAEDLKDLAVFTEYDQVRLGLVGTIGHAIGIDEYANETDTHILSRLVPISLEGDNIWGYSLLRRIGLKKLSLQNSAHYDNLDDFHLEVDNVYHAIYSKENEVVVVLK